MGVALRLAELEPIRSERRQFLSKLDLIEVTMNHQADHGLSSDLEALNGDTSGCPFGYCILGSCVGSSY